MCICTNIHARTKAIHTACGFGFLLGRRKPLKPKRCTGTCDDSVHHLQHSFHRICLITHIIKETYVRGLFACSFYVCNLSHKNETLTGQRREGCGAIKSQHRADKRAHSTARDHTQRRGLKAPRIGRPTNLKTETEEHNLRRAYKGEALGPEKKAVACVYV